ncbi:hypothetical protein GCM10027596_26790 [Nocardioides korecus]
MTWTKLDDGFHAQASLLRCSDAAFRLYVTGLTWGNQQGTDGRTPLEAVYTFGIRGEVKDAIDELVRVGLWSEVHDEDGEAWQADWAHQEDSVVVAERRARQSEKSARDRLRQDMHKAGDHRLCAAPRYCGHADPRNAQRVVRRGVVGEIPDDTRGVARGETPRPVPTRSDPSRPDPARPQGRVERGGGTGANSAGATSTTGPGGDKPRPHDFPYDAFPDLEALYPEPFPRGTICPACGLPEGHIAHMSHDYSGDETVTTCNDCGAPPDHIWHTWHLEAS